MKVTDKIEITNEDNMELMDRYPDNYFSLAIVDPPYGIDVNMNAGRVSATKKHTKKNWDKSTPNAEYFKELFRVSQNQIIWGGNYFKELPTMQSWIFWDKCVAEKCSFSDGELAWTSFGGALKKVTIPWSGFIGSDGDKIHPTQKPVKLYEWLLRNYAKPNDKILDTHLGSGSIAIAIDNMNKIENMNLSLTACELDKEYYDKSIERIKRETAQTSLFENFL